jgi:hypothetical protein
MLGSKGTRGKGTEKKKVLPSPSVDSTPIVPPTPSTYRLAMLSPNPETPAFWTPTLMSQTSMAQRVSLDLQQRSLKESHHLHWLECECGTTKSTQYKRTFHFTLPFLVIAVNHEPRRPIPSLKLPSKSYKYGRHEREITIIWQLFTLDIEQD